MKQAVEPVSALPTKRLYFSIIVDYDLNKALCELIDNVLDIWIGLGRKRTVTVNVAIDVDQKTIQVEDDAGGLDKEDLSLVVAPGHTLASGSDPSIGIFGVGSKRAVVALARDVRIRTRGSDAPSTFLVEFDETWIDGSEDWELPCYRVDNIAPGTTQIELSRLRVPVNQEVVDNLTKHLGLVYSEFLGTGRFRVLLNGKPVEPVRFDDWSYLPGFAPIDYKGRIVTPESDSVRVRLRAGLMRHSSPTGEWGVYFYCNDRFIVGAVKDSSVGFVTGPLGQPSADLSLLRAELWLEGPSRTMPWNSTKSGIHQDHRVFASLRDWLAKTLKDWASLSRRLQGEWTERVTPFDSGVIVAKEITSFDAPGRSYLPPLPRARRGVDERVRHANETVTDEKPWVTGLYEAVVATDLILRKRFDQRNRIALILLDSTLEIAFKEYLVNEVTSQRYSDARLKEIFQNRHEVETEVKKHTHLTTKTWAKIRFFYDLRSKLIHERATASVSDRQIEDYGRTVKQILAELFGLQFPD